MKVSASVPRLASPCPDRPALRRQVEARRSNCGRPVKSYSPGATSVPGATPSWPAATGVLQSLLALGRRSCPQRLLRPRRAAAPISLRSNGGAEALSAAGGVAGTSSEAKSNGSGVGGVSMDVAGRTAGGRSYRIPAPPSPRRPLPASEIEFVGGRGGRHHDRPGGLRGYVAGRDPFFVHRRPQVGHVHRLLGGNNRLRRLGRLGFAPQGGLPCSLRRRALAKIGRRRGLRSGRRRRVGRRPGALGRCCQLKGRPSASPLSE